MVYAPLSDQWYTGLVVNSVEFTEIDVVAFELVQMIQHRLAAPSWHRPRCGRHPKPCSAWSIDYCVNSTVSVVEEAWIGLGVRFEGKSSIRVRAWPWVWCHRAERC